MENRLLLGSALVCLRFQVSLLAGQLAIGLEIVFEGVSLLLGAVLLEGKIRLFEDSRISFGESALGELVDASVGHLYVH